MADKKAGTKMDDNLKVAVKSASYNMMLQVTFRLGTFSMNAILLRYLTKETLGIMNVRLLLLYSTILFISREAFRKACLTQVENSTSVTRTKLKNIINLIWVSILVGIISSVILSWIWIMSLSQPTTALLTQQYHISTILIAISCLLELAVEPFWILGQRNSMFTLKVILEGIFLLTRCCLTTILIILFPHQALLVYGVAFVLASGIYFLCYVTYFYQLMNELKKREDTELHVLTGFRDLFPDYSSIDKSFDKQYVYLILSFYKQSLLKQFLTEGERYIMTIFGILSFSQQGIYDVINNLGSLAARFIFMPIEETYYTFFSQVLLRGKSAVEQKPENLSQAIKSLSLVLKFVSLIGLTILIFGFSYSRLLLDFYGGKILSNDEGTSLLQAYCLYVLIIAINGITECFMFASMSKNQLDRYNYKMLFFSCVFLLASLLFTKYLGSIGFIFANCLNMALRILQSTAYIKEFFKSTTHTPLSSIFPSKGVMMGFLLSFAMTSLSERTFGNNGSHVYQLLHVCIGGVCLLVVAASVYFTEHNIVNFAKSFIDKKRKKE